jgi:hypothetical protein
MKFRPSYIFSLPLLLASSHMALAAATPEEAARLAAVFQTFLGAGPTVVKVTPNSDDYTVTVDISSLTAKMAASGADVKMSPITFALSNKGAGKWGIDQNSPFEFHLSAKQNFKASFKAESYVWSGIFDENLATFEQASGEIKGLTLTENFADPNMGLTDIHAAIKSVKVSQAAVANSSGGADVNIKYDFEGFTENLSLPTFGEIGSSLAVKPTTSPPQLLSISAASGSSENAITNLKTKSVLDLVAFFVAHTDKDAIIKDQEKLKSLLNAAVPVFNNVKGSTSLKTISIASPVGPIAIDTFTIGADINGVVKDGKFGESISITGLSVPAAVVPTWAATLVPKNMTLDFTTTGFNLEAPAQLILAAMDLAKDPPVADSVQASLFPALMPSGSVTITLNPTSISNDIYAISAQGAVTAGPAAQPSGKAVVKATGLDEILKAIQAAPPEAGVQGNIGIIVAAKGMAKAEADGSLTWNIESTPDGKVLINGFDPNKMQ